VSSVSAVFSLSVSVLLCSDIYIGTTFVLGRDRMVFFTEFNLLRGNVFDIPEWGVLVVYLGWKCIVTLHQLQKL
jgi:hypothetical protein